MKTISLINMKGGVGKTTLAVNIGYALAKLRGKRVLLVDADPQFNATQYLVQDTTYLAHLDAGKRTVYNILVGTPPTVTTVSRRKRSHPPHPPTLANTVISIYAGTSGKLDLVPSQLELLEAQNIERGGERRLATFLETATNEYDYAIIDCPPTISVFTLSAFLASDGYLVPVKPDPLSTIGLPLLERAMSEYTRLFQRTVTQVGIVPTMMRANTNLMTRTLAAMRRRWGAKVFAHSLSHSVYVAAAVEARQPLFEYPDTRIRWGQELSDITDEFETACGTLP